MHLLRKSADFEAFQHDMVEALQRDPIRILSYRVLSITGALSVSPELPVPGTASELPANLRDIARARFAWQ
jgi:hypothetical protein